MHVPSHPEFVDAVGTVLGAVAATVGAITGGGGGMSSSRGFSGGEDGVAEGLLVVDVATTGAGAAYRRQTQRAPMPTTRKIATTAYSAEEPPAWGMPAGGRLEGVIGRADLTGSSAIRAKSANVYRSGAQKAARSLGGP